MQTDNEDLLKSKITSAFTGKQSSYTDEEDISAAEEEDISDAEEEVEITHNEAWRLEVGAAARLVLVLHRHLGAQRHPASYYPYKYVAVDLPISLTVLIKLRYWNSSCGPNIA